MDWRVWTSSRLTCQPWGIQICPGTFVILSLPFFQISTQNLMSRKQQRWCVKDPLPVSDVKEAFFHQPSQTQLELWGQNNMQVLKHEHVLVVLVDVLFEPLCKTCFLIYIIYERESQNGLTALSNEFHCMSDSMIQVFVSCWSVHTQQICKWHILA